MLIMWVLSVLRDSKKKFADKVSIRFINKMQFHQKITFYSHYKHLLAYITQQLIATERKVETFLKKVLIHFLHLTVQFFAFGPLGRNHNRRQNFLRHFALRGPSDVLQTSKGENKVFPPPSPPCNVVLLFKLPVENNKIPQL